MLRKLNSFDFENLGGFGNGEYSKKSALLTSYLLLCIKVWEAFFGHYFGEEADRPSSE
jgi:hypothetical protein